MKHAILISFFVFYCFATRAQHSESLQFFPNYHASDSDTFRYNHPMICDTLNHIFNIILTDNSVHGMADTLQNKYMNDTLKSVSTASRPVFDNDNIATASPYVYACQYESGKDSARMFSVFSNLIPIIGRCMSQGIVQDMDVKYERDIDDKRIMRYTYYIRSVKPGIDPKIKSMSVSVQFFPDTRGYQADAYTLYRVNIIVRP